MSPLSGPTSDPVAADARDRALAAMDDVQTVGVTMTVAVVTPGTSDSVTLSRVVNQRTNRGRFNVSAPDGERRIYVANDSLWAKQGGDWEFRTRNSAPWTDGASVERQRSLLDSGRVTFLRNDSLDGHPVTVVEAHPDDDAVAALTGTRELDSYTVRLWIGRETGYVWQSRAEASVSRGGESATTTVTTRFRWFDRPVTVDIPSAALSA